MKSRTFWQRPFVLVVLSSLLVTLAGTGCKTASKASDTAAHTPQPVVVPQASVPVADTMKASSASNTGENSMDLTCTSGKVERKIQVVKKDGGCELLYTKDGKAESRANARTGVAYCEEKAKKIRTNLENAQFKCE